MAINEDDMTFKKPVTMTGGTTITGAVDLSSASVSMPAGQALKRYVSQRIDTSMLIGGSATQTIALTGEPTAMIPIAAYIVTASSLVSGNGGTTGCTAEVGTSGDADGYLVSHSIFGAPARKEGTAGVMISAYRNSDALLLKLTASGGSANIGHLDQMDLRVVVLYTEVSAES